MGTVYRARHALLRRPTAVKVLRADNAGPATIARFEREVQLTSEIAHPNIVSVYDFGRSPDGSFYYAMEYLEGVDLQRLVENDGPQPAARVAHILEQAAEALAEAHSVSLIHRDIKPANIVLCKHARRPDHVKVVDFGLVKQVGNADAALSAVNVITGTPLYMPPEALTSPDEVDARGDLYSLGAVGYFLLTGEAVFVGKTVLEVCAQTLHERVIPPSERVGLSFPPALEALVMACLSKSKTDRPGNAEAFIAALRACDVPAWTLDDARRWWRSNHDIVEARTASHPSEIARTLAVAPR
jgi:eukaryotic-like serine/threonine-protein kinase